MTEKKIVLISMIENSRKKLDTAQLLLSNFRNDDAVSRAYYAVFHAISAVLLSRGLTYSSHAQVIGAFNREFVRTGILPADFSKKVLDLFNYRQTGDYSIDPLIDHKLAKTLIDDASLITDLIERYLQSIGVF